MTNWFIIFRTSGCVVLLWLCLLSNPGLADDAGQKVLARVGKALITEADLDYVVKNVRLKGQFAQALKTHSPEGRKELLGQMIETLLLYYAAKECGFLETEAMKQKLRWSVAQLVAEEYVQKELFAQKPSEEEMNRFYASHRGLFEVPARVKARHVVVKEESKAEGLLRELENGTSFEALAGEHNIDAPRNLGGLIGWMRAGMMVEAFEKAAFGLNKGDISHVVKTESGYHIIKVDDRKEGYIKPFKDAKADVLKAIRKKQLEAFKDELKKALEIKVYE